jgi:hypothetical protein
VGGDSIVNLLHGEVGQLELIAMQVQMLDFRPGGGGGGWSHVVQNLLVVPFVKGNLSSSSLLRWCCSEGKEELV